MPEQRKLAAIMFTDVVGYTALMQKNEHEAVSLINHHQSILEKKVAEHHGEVVSYYGDGSLSIFASITQALQCAMEIQQILLQDPKVPLRIGLHTGEVFFENGNLIGDAVNLASRIQSLGKAGTILFSKEVFEKTRNHHQFKSVFLGSFILKNVAEPMEIFALANEGLVVPGKEDLVGVVRPVVTARQRFKWPIMLSVLLIIVLAIFVIKPFLDKRKYHGLDKSIAVLPFKNMSNDTVQEYFSDGITEDIVTQLSKIAGLRVISSSSAMQYKNAPYNIKQIAADLHVASVLEGSVRREGRQVRITAQLIDPNTDQQIWANNYDRGVNEVFAIQSEVAQQIAGELNVRLTADEGKRIQKKVTNNVAAYEQYLLARKSRGDEAEKLLLSALQKDSTFALAWASLALIYARRPPTDSTDRPYYIRKSLTAALTAVNYGPDLAETHMVLGDVLKTITLNPELSIKELNKSILLNPNNAEGYVYLSFALSEMGRFPEAEKNLLKAKQLDPISGIMRGAWFNYYIYSRNIKALGRYLHETDTSGAGNFARGIWISYYFLKDDYDSVLLKGSGRFRPETAIALIKTGNIKQADKLVDSLINVSENDNALNIGIVYAWLGDKQKAMKYLTIAYRLYDYTLVSIKVNKLFDPLRNEAAFKNLLFKMEIK